MYMISSPDDLQRLATIRNTDRDIYREGGSNLQLRDDIHFLLQHIDELIAVIHKDDCEASAH